MVFEKNTITVKEIFCLQTVISSSFLTKNRSMPLYYKQLALFIVSCLICKLDSSVVVKARTISIVSEAHPQNHTLADEPSL